MFRRTKIICTIGPAVSSVEKIDELVDAGMNVARINFSHGTHQQHAQTIANIKKVRKKREVALSILLDTKGPEVRLGEVENGKIEVRRGDLVELTRECVTGTKEKISCTPPCVLDSLQPKMKVLIDDGYITATVKEKTKNGALIFIENNGEIKSKKSVSLPFAQHDLPAMTDQDREDIAFGCKHDIDMIAASFIRSAEHVIEIKKLLVENGKPEVMVIAKIESALGVEHFDAILQVSDGIMVARGDLGVELPLTQVPRLQKMMIRKSCAAFKPVVTATQMLESMIKNPLPTRAEASDVANAIYDSSSAVMLSGETAVGLYPIKAVSLMSDIVMEAEKDVNYLELFYRDMSRLTFHDISSSVALATVKTAYSADAKAIFAFTSSGFTAKAMSRFRPQMPIIALTDNKKTFNQLALLWGVVPVFAHVRNLTEAINAASCYALQHKLVKYGDLIVITAGSPFGVTGTTNTMLVDHIGDVLVRGFPRRGRKVHGKVAHALATDDRAKPFLFKGKVVLITQCDESYDAVFKEAEGIVLQNHPDDEASEKQAIALSRKYKKPIILRADGASALLREGQLVTLEPSKGLIFKGYLENEEQILAKFCKVNPA